MYSAPTFFLNLLLNSLLFLLPFQTSSHKFFQPFLQLSSLTFYLISSYLSSQPTLFFILLFSSYFPYPLPSFRTFFAIFLLVSTLFFPFSIPIDLLSCLLFLPSFLFFLLPSFLTLFPSTFASLPIFLPYFLSCFFFVPSYLLFLSSYPTFFTFTYLLPCLFLSPSLPALFSEKQKECK